jgi:hypothetical protein
MNLSLVGPPGRYIEKDARVDLHRELTAHTDGRGRPAT